MIGSMEELSGISLSPGGTPGLFSEKNLFGNNCVKNIKALKRFLGYF
jgi:hypothetical protein